MAEKYIILFVTSQERKTNIWNYCLFVFFGKSFELFNEYETYFCVNSSISEGLSNFVFVINKIARGFLPF